MIKQNEDLQKIGQANLIEQVNTRIEANKVSEEKPPKEVVDNDSLERSFEVIPPSLVSKVKMDLEGSNESEGKVQQATDIGHDKSSSNASSRKNSLEDRVKRPGSFLSKLQSSSGDNDGNGSNLPSSIVSAFTSLSSFTSNFSLNSSTSENHSASALTIETASTSTKLNQITESREDVFNKKAALERKNLINLTKLIVKDLISSSLKSSRTLDDCDDAIHLRNYFTLIDRVLKHGLKQNLLSNRFASLWSALDSLPKYLKESTLMSESVRSLKNTKTPDGKIKAWMRLAMMQKKLPEYFSELLANKNVLLKEIYHDYAFMLNDEAHVFAGLIIGVNVIDCNFFIKDENFDLIDNVIDLSPYLRSANSYDDDREGPIIRNEQPSEVENLTAVLDQKNYLEEWNKRLESTISDLQSRIKSLEQHNSQLEMEAKVSEVRISKLQGKNNDMSSDKQVSSLADTIKSFIGNTEMKQQLTDHNQLETSEAPITSEDEPESDQKMESSNVEDVAPGEQPDTDQFNKISDAQKAESELQKLVNQQENELACLKERASILESSYRSSLEKIKCLERDLDVQTSMNVDKETTIKIYEKDIRDKQAQVEALRASLNDSKKMNSSLNERLDETNQKLKDRIKSVSTLQASLDKWKLEYKNMATRLQDKQTAFKSMTSDLENAMKNIEELKAYNKKVNDDLKKERESGHSSSVTLETQNAKINELTNKLIIMEAELREFKTYKDHTEELTKKCRDYEQSLEEIGSQLRESRLEVENLKENSAVFLDSQWMDSKQVRDCTLCQQSFSVTRRKHHCRLCGNVFCQTCSDNKMELASSSKPVRVCDTCHAFLLAKFVKSST